MITTLKFINNIDIIIDNNQQRSEKYFFFDAEKNHKNNSWKSSLNSDHIFPTLITMLFNKMMSITKHNDSIKKLCNLYIKSKQIKIVRHKNITLTIYKL